MYHQLTLRLDTQENGDYQVCPVALAAGCARSLDTGSGLYSADAEPAGQCLVANSLSY